MAGFAVADRYQFQEPRRDFVSHLFGSFPRRAPARDISFVHENLAQFVIRGLPAFKLRAKRIEEIFDLSFALDDIAQHIGFDLIRNKRIVNQP